MLTWIRNMLSKRASPPAPEQWCVGEGARDGKKFLFRIRQDRTVVYGRTGLPHLLRVTWKFECDDETGLPGDQALQDMEVLEEILVEVLESHSAAMMTVVVTWNGLREWLWYCSDPNETRRLIEEGIAGHEPFRVTFAFAHDPEWRAFEQFVRSGPR